MRHIRIHEYGTTNADIDIVMDAIARDDVWFEVTDKWSKHFGCIGKLDLTDFHSKVTKYRKDPKFIRFAKMSPFLIFSGMEKMPLVIGKKSIQISPTEQHFVEGHNGVPNYVYRKSVWPAWSTPQDILGSDIVPGAFVAASGGTGMFLAKVEEIFPERFGDDIRLRARLQVIVDRELLDWLDRATGKTSLPYRSTSPSPTVAIDNLMVIVPDIKQQAMIVKLAKP